MKIANQIVILEGDKVRGFLSELGVDLEKYELMAFGEDYADKDNFRVELLDKSYKEELDAKRDAVNNAPKIPAPVA